MKRSILGGLALSAALMTMNSVHAAGFRRVNAGRSAVRRSPVSRISRHVRPVRRAGHLVRKVRPIRRIGRVPSRRRNGIVNRPIVRKPIRPVRPIRRVRKPSFPFKPGKIVKPIKPVGGKIRPIVGKRKPFVRPKGWMKKFGKSYHKKYGKKYGFGWCYFGNWHCHWTKCSYLPSYGCYGYWCPYTLCWYYWCEPYGCYFPVTYCPTGWYCY